MRRFAFVSVVAVVAVFAVIAMVAGGSSFAQGTPATPGAEAEFCATPAATPSGSPAASPEIDTSASPAVVATEVAELEGALDTVVCATPAADQAAGGAVQMEAYDIGWRTADQPGPRVALTVAAGSTIEITNTGAAQHNFEARQLGLYADLPPGATVEVVVPAATAPGTYDFICSIPGHAQAGQVGTLTIQ